MQTKYRLICCEPDRNSYKFWFADIEGATVTRHWGRVGFKGQAKTFTYRTVGEADEVTRKKAQEKKRGRWSKADSCYISTYVELSLLEGEHQQAVANQMTLEQKALSEIGAQETEAQRLIKYLVKSNIHRIISNTSIQWSGGQLVTALGPITPDAVRQGQSFLNMIARALRDGEQHQIAFRSLVADYLKVVPIKIGMKFEPLQIFPDMSAIRSQQEILDSMSALTVSPSPDSSDIPLFEVSLSLEDNQAIIRDWVAKWRDTIHRGHSSACLEFSKLWRLNIATMTQAYDDSIGNVFELFHGTKASNLLAILQGGMKIMPADANHINGRAYGDGLYFSDRSTKALNYSYQGWYGEQRFFMLTSKVAMGRVYTPRSATWGPPPSGYDSIWAKAGRSGVKFNEMVVFSRARVLPHHLMEFKKKG